MLSVAARVRLGAFALDAELDLDGAGCTAIAGPSGAGKSTLLRVVAGLLHPDAGHVRCGGETWLDVAHAIDLPPERRRCGYVFQDYALFPHLSAWRNVAYGIGGPRAGRRAAALALLDRFGLAERATQRPATLSGGERQRVALARALAREPAALLLDEPLAALDSRTRAHAGRELRAILRATAVPALIVTHDFTEAALLGDDVAVLDAGRIVQRGAAAELASAPASAFVADFTGAVVLLGEASAGPDGLTRVELDHGAGAIASTDGAGGRVVATVFPSEITIETAASPPPSSARNHLPATITTVTPLGNRVRLGLDAGQPLTAEITQAAADELPLHEGAAVTATWKAASTRLVAG